jgi:hypothetical protein
MKRAVILFVAMLITTSFALARTGPGGGSSGCPGLLTIVAELPYEEVDAVEEADALLMREEEKLARDVYLAMDDLWGLRVFSQISWSEQSHMDAVLAVIDKYGIVDPVSTNPPGVFTDPALQQTFDLLFDQGSQSLIDALVVGATIEDLDIHDLDVALSRTDNLDLRTVYQNLQKGSRNHLRAFVGLLQANGETYEPQYISQAEFDAIVSSPKEHGLMDADGEPVDCTAGGGGGSGPGPGGKAHRRHRHIHRNQQQQGVEAVTPLQ